MSRIDPPEILRGLRNGGRDRLRTRGGEILLRFVPPLMARIRTPELDALGKRVTSDAPADVAATMARSIFRELAASRRLIDRAEVLRYAVSRADAGERKVLLARHIRVTVSSRWDRLWDEAALGRGQLDLECLMEREEKVVDELLTRVEVACGVLTGLLRSHPEVVAPLTASGVFPALAELARHGRRRPTQRAAVQALVAAAAARNALFLAVDPTLIRDLAGIAAGKDPWMARDAVEAGPELPSPGAWLVEQYDQWSGVSDGGLVRSRCVELLYTLDPLPDDALLARFCADDSELVRFSLVTALVACEAAAPLLDRLQSDPSETVRAWTAASLADGGAPVRQLLVHALDGSESMQKHALEGCKHLHREGTVLPEDVCEKVRSLSVSGPMALRARAQEVLALQPVVNDPLGPLVDTLRALPEGERRVVRLDAAFSARDLAEALVPAAIDDFGFWLEPLGRGRVRVHRGDRSTVGLWRVLHELSGPAPAKRQGARHTVVSEDLGSIRVPPSTIDEASATEVPGQRVRSVLHGSWMPSVPLPDDALDALRRGEVTVVSAQGTTVLRAPGGVLDRARSWLRLTGRLAVYSRLRRESLESLRDDARDAYMASLAQLGLQTEHHPPGRRGVTLLSVDVLTYFLGLGTNTTRHLLGALTILGVGFYLQAIRKLRLLRRSRARIPLVIGGWGTRGKSGTERLKMGLLTGLGVPTLAKTTGCEAMVLHTPRGRDTEDLYLFRPFDKATIWEQSDVIQLADGLGSRVLLWECMALRPSFVDLLQHRWVRDDLSTLTNAYADHEDVMGPSGVDVARTIASFCPDRACLITTEEPMFPIIAGEAARRSTELRQPPLHHRELIPADLLARFPYREHPSNIALAAGVAEALGIPRTEAIGLMAEYVVPDLGALVVYPTIPIEQRQVTFVNGMSANDTISFLHSWKAGGMADTELDDPLQWRITVVNNRADRVARSQVFARILVQHTHADRHVLIGTNLGGLRNWVEEELWLRAEKLPADAGPEERMAFLQHVRVVDPIALSRQLIRAHDARPELHAAFVSALEGCPPVTTELPARSALPAPLRAASVAVEQACDQPGVAEALEEASRRWLLAAGATAAGVPQTRSASVALFLASLHLVDDASASGDEIMALSALQAPPGAQVRLMGCQNIKGTGLDFAWQWVWWRKAHLALPGLSSEEPGQRVEALGMLEALPLQSAAACQVVCDALSPLTTDPELGRSAAALRNTLEARIRDLRAARLATRAMGLWQRLLLRVERFLDPFDAILRRRSARRIFRDLAAARVSHSIARERLKDLTKRQKGGWLVGRDKQVRSADLGVSDPQVFG